MKHALPTAERIREVLDYDCETGVFRWRNPTPQQKKKAGEAGCLDTRSGYVKVYVDGKSYLAHRLAWLHVTGTWPTKCIDHKNGNTADNRITNLRDVTHQENVENRRIRSATSSNTLGVSFDANHPGPMKYRAKITYAHRCIGLGRFRTLEEAAAAYHGAKCVLHKGYLPGPSV